jgi:hypothetical protein
VIAEANLVLGIVRPYPISRNLFPYFLRFSKLGFGICAARDGLYLSAAFGADNHS